MNMTASNIVTLILAGDVEVMRGDQIIAEVGDTTAADTAILLRNPRMRQSSHQPGALIRSDGRSGRNGQKL